INIPFGFIVNKNDVQNISDDKLSELKNITEDVLSINTKDETYINQIKQMILKIMPDNFFDDEKILNDMISAGDTVIQVIPIDKAAPKGRLILPQVRTIRNVLDIGANSIVTSPEKLNNVLNNLKQPPKLVITDSQAFKKVNEIVPDNISLTSYSILFARLKGDLKEFFEGAKEISKLKENDKVLICESCTHHVTCEDIARVKIPKLMKNYTKKNLFFEFCSGHNFPKNLKEYSLIIHCGACMTNKKEVLSRIILAKENNIPITNYGITISCCLGILERATKIFNL
ncbi:MAG: [FeFe] hydrogenase H-cluster maturation GTPase HydF, partial [Candidatus Gastranaerophilales bacterium]|nr:[FeFe] hydrogenase H-cluster maturation GTPase HydF [Candidatus Gastranaerophilales bacterium]